MAACQGRVSALALAFVLFALTGGLSCAQAAQHQVGGAPGWSLPSMANVNYTVWASAQKFVVGDTLYFNYSKAYHNVLEVTKANYDSCNAASPISTHDDGNTILPLNQTGTFYYICGIPTHCTLGQKFSAGVVKASSSSPSSSPTPGSSAPGASTSSGSSSSTPSNSSAHSSAAKWAVSTVFAASASFLLF